MSMLLERGYNHLGIPDILAKTKVPKGSFYHHFESKEEFALAVVDRYMVQVHAALDACLGDPSIAPLRRIRKFFEAVRESYRHEGYLGCLLGGLGQELSGISPVFRRKIDECITQIAARIAGCLDEAVERGDLPRGTQTRELADLLTDCWEGAALRSRLRRNPAPLEAMLDFYFRAIGGAGMARPRRSRS